MSLFSNALGCLTGSASSSAKAAREKGATIIDVRGHDEWADGHLEDSTLIPLPELAQRVGEIVKLVGGDKTKPIVIVCRSGGRAGQARSLLLQHGFTDVVNGGGWTSLR